MREASRARRLPTRSHFLLIALAATWGCIEEDDGTASDDRGRADALVTDALADVASDDATLDADAPSGDAQPTPSPCETHSGLVQPRAEDVPGEPTWAWACVKSSDPSIDGGHGGPRYGPAHVLGIGSGAPPGPCDSIEPGVGRPPAGANGFWLELQDHEDISWRVGFAGLPLPPIAPGQEILFAYDYENFDGPAELVYLAHSSGYVHAVHNGRFVGAVPPPFPRGAGDGDLELPGLRVRLQAACPRPDVGENECIFVAADLSVDLPGRTVVVPFRRRVVSAGTVIINGGLGLGFGGGCFQNFETAIAISVGPDDMDRLPLERPR